MRWISVKDKTPPKDRFVLAVFETTYEGKKASKVTLAWYVGWYKRHHWEIFDDEEGRMMADDFFNGGITHWMPLPELPEEANDDD